MPAPNLMAAILARQTKRVRIAILGNAAPLYDQPLKVAEEVAMIDVISGGRVIAGFVRGVGAEYFSFSDEPRLLARALRRGDRPDPPGLDRAGPVQPPRQALPVPLRQPLAASPSRSRTRASSCRPRAAWRPWSGPPRRASPSSASTTRSPPCSACSRSTASAQHGAAGKPARSTSAGWCRSTWRRQTPRPSRRPSGTSSISSAS